MRDTFLRLISLAMKEFVILRTLHASVVAKLDRLQAEDPGLEQFLARAHGFALFPSVGKAALVAGGAFGKGEVFQHHALIGYAGIIQATLGVQWGGDTFVELIVFQNRPALERFKQGQWTWTANASAVIVTAGAAASANYDHGVAVFVWSEGGLLLEAAVGAQKFVFRPAVLGRTQQAPSAGRTR